MTTQKQYAVVVAPNSEFLSSALKLVAKGATAMAHKVFATKKEAEKYCKMFNNSYNQTKIAGFKKL